MAVKRERTRPAAVFVELFRLAVVVLATAGTYELAARSQLGEPLRGLGDTMVLLAICLGAAVGYVAGGMLGRFALGRVDAAERQLRSVSSGELFAGAIGGFVGLLLGAALTWPLLLIRPQVYTLPGAVVGRGVYT
jgi:uncharacterized protein YacL